LWRWPNHRKQLNKQFVNKITNVVGPINNCNPEGGADILECWDWQERQAKFIVNSIRVYEFFGYKWRLPLWDKELIEYWARIPLEKRINRYLYFKYVNTKQYEINKKLELSIKNEESNFRKWYMMNIGYKYRRIHKFIKTFVTFRSRINEYEENPLQFYGMYAKKRYMKSLFKSGILNFNINSLLVEDYLNLFEIS